MEGDNILSELFPSLSKAQFDAALRASNGDIEAAAVLLSVAPPSMDGSTEPCPICDVSIDRDGIEAHVEWCLSGLQTASSASASASASSSIAVAKSDDDIDDDEITQLMVPPPPLSSEEQRDFEMAKLMQSHLDMEEELKRLRNTLKDKEDQPRYNGPVQVNLRLDSVPVPDYWDESRDGFHSVDVVQDSDEWKRVDRHFSRSIPNVRVHRIERIQNTRLWTYYALKREEISAKNGGDANGEEWWRRQREMDVSWLSEWCVRDDHQGRFRYARCEYGWCDWCWDLLWRNRFCFIWICGESRGPQEDDLRSSVSGLRW